MSEVVEAMSAVSFFTYLNSRRFCLLSLAQRQAKLDALMTVARNALLKPVASESKAAQKGECPGDCG